MRILVTDGMDKTALETLRAKGHEVVEQFYAPEELGEAIRDFDVVVVRSATKVRANHIDAAKGSRLKLIIRGGVGVDNIDVAYAEANGIAVKNTPRASSNSVAELALAHMLSCARFVSIAGHTMREGKWEKKAYGKGVELGGKHNKELATFNLDNLRFNKIVICTDADVDGYQIRTLVLTMLYRLTPTLINEGYVYIAESPLYEITTKDRTYFAYTEPEKATFLEEIGDKKYTIQRSKGLGENDPEMMWLTTMNPESRRLIKVMPTDVERTAQVFDILLGDNLAGRKEHIAQHGAEYLDDLDVS